MAEPKEPAMQHDSRPVPDPTALTTEALKREIATLKEQVFQRIDGDKDLNDEKFKGVEKQFQAKDLALNAALQAAKEAGEKSENNFTKQIDAQSVLINTKNEAMNAAIEQVRASQIRSEGKGAGIAAMISGAISLAAVVIALLSWLNKAP